MGLENDTRIATWREPAALASNFAKDELAHLNRHVKIFLGVALACPIFGVLLGSVSTFGAFCNGYFHVALPFYVIVLLGSFLSRRYKGYTEPMPVYDHGDALTRMNVIVQLDVEGHRYGEDRGELTLADDWLVFEGERTTFSLAPHDVSVLLRGMSQFGRRPAGLRIKAATADVRLWIMADDPHSDASQLLEWWIVKTIPPPAISVLPPLVPMPGLRKRGWFRQAAPRDVFVRNNFLILLPLYVFGVANVLGPLKGMPPFLSMPLALLLVLTLGFPFWAYQRHSRRKAFESLWASYKALCASPLSAGLLEPPCLRSGANDGFRAPLV